MSICADNILVACNITENVGTDKISNQKCKQTNEKQPEKKSSHSRGACMFIGRD